jgi:tagaturonate reductase
VPELFAAGFAAYLLFMKGVSKVDEKVYGERSGVRYLIQDDQAPVMYKRWQSQSPAGVVKSTLGDIAFWGSDLSLLSGFHESVHQHLLSMIDKGVKGSLENIQIKKAVA